MSRLLRGDKVLIAAAVIALIALGVALRPQHTGHISVTPAAATVDRPAPPLPNRPTALVISDAYTSGSGMAETSYLCAAVTRMGWLCDLAAEPGTGYISGGTANRFTLDQGSGKSTSFGERIPVLGAKYKPDVVILDGGRNDVFAPPDARFQVTTSTIWQVHKTWPNARIIVVKPRFLARPDDDLGLNDGIMNQIREGSDVKDLIFIDPIKRFTPTTIAGLVSPDGTNPSAQGERALATAFAEALAQSGIPPAR